CEATTSVEQLREALAAYSHVPVYATRFLPRHLRRLGSEEALPLDALGKSPLGSFCGIGNPDGFRRTLTHLHAEVKISRDYPDHFWFRKEDLVELRKLGQGSGVAAWITTEKDAMRLMDEELWRHLGDVYYPEMEVEFLGDEAGFFGMLDPYSARGEDVR
ncbi:MAG: tetraacyldisaccharide 4'-kinase, partial [Bacteroidota bacterium]